IATIGHRNAQIRNAMAKTVFHRAQRYGCVGVESRNGRIDSSCPALYDFYMIQRRVFSWVLPTITAAAAFISTGCSTVESRISEHRDLYASLPSRQQQLVAQGQIGPGMSQDAVWLAWGSAEQKVNGYARGNATETWVYYATTTAYPYGYGGYGRFGYGP